MNDDPRPHELDEREALAASAVVDGTETADERALVDASPQLEAWIESYHHILAELDDVPVPTAARASALAAALAVFDELHAVDTPAAAAAPAAADAVATPTAAVVSLADRARRRWNPRIVLGAAAAVVAVLAIGGVIIDRGRSNDDTLSSADTASPLGETSRKTDASSAPQLNQTQMAPVESAAPAMTISAIPAGGADVGTATPTMDAASADTAAPTATDAPADTTAGAAPSTFASTVTERVLDQQELLAYAARVIATGGSPAATTPAPAPARACPTDGAEVLGDVLYGPDAVPARVVRDLTTGAIRAESLDTCQVLTSVTP